MTAATGALLVAVGLLTLIVNHILARLAYVEVGFGEGLPEFARPELGAVDLTSLGDAIPPSGLVVFATPRCTSCRALLQHLHDVEHRLPVAVSAQIVGVPPEGPLPDAVHRITAGRLERAGIDLFPFVVITHEGRVIEARPVGRPADLDALVSRAWTTVDDPVRQPGAA